MTDGNVTEKKYVLIGGHTESGQFITATQLIGCYGLDRSECVLASSAAMAAGMRVAGKIVLRPRTAGDYRETLATMHTNHGVPQ